MSLSPYAEVLRSRGAPGLFALVIGSRLPLCAAGMVITLHVVIGLRHGYTAAGVAGAAVTVGVAVGSPLMGRVLDSRGLRRLVAFTATAEGVFWCVAWALPYAALLPAAFVSGVFALPANSLGRQAVAALVPERRRRTALSMDSISVELTYMVGPALGVLVCTRFSTSAAMVAVGAAMLLAGLGLYVVNPRVLAEGERDTGASRPRRRTWLGPAMCGLLVVGVGTDLTLVGAELAMVAALRDSGQVAWTGAAVAVACLASIAGGLVYGAQHRPVPPALLLVVLAGLTVPVGLAGDTWWLLALVWIPSNLACAPAVAAVNEYVMWLAPASARGEAMGLAASSTTLGVALGSPLAGAVIDAAGPGVAFAATGAAGLLLAGIATALGKAANRRSGDRADGAMIRT